ncbi:MAG: hypothetical protein WBQ17_14295 [Rhizomicrobium sp.]
MQPARTMQLHHAPEIEQWVNSPCRRLDPHIVLIRSEYRLPELMGGGARLGGRFLDPTSAQAARREELPCYHAMRGTQIAHTV